MFARCLGESTQAWNALAASPKLRGLREKSLAFACLTRIRGYRALRMFDALRDRHFAARLAGWNR